MKKSAISFALWFFLLLLYFPNPVLAANETTLDVTAPSTVDIDEGFQVKAIYRSNGTKICGASCRISGGGWLTGYWFMDEAGCEYSKTMYAPGSSGTYTMTVECEKAGYDSAIRNFNVYVEKAGAELTFDANPPGPFPGDKVDVTAYYRNTQGYLIDGSCNAKLQEDGRTVSEIYLAYLSGLYYRGSLSLPEKSGSYSITVACSDNQYKTVTKSIYFQARKMESELAVSYPSSLYYGYDAEIRAQYTNKMAPITGTCTATFNGEERQMFYSDRGYTATIKMPYIAGQKSLDVRCSSARYETIERKVFINPADRPTYINVISPTGRVFYPTEKIQIKVYYADNTTRNIPGAQCHLDGSTPLTLRGESYETEVSKLDVGTKSFSIRCSKQFYQEITRTLTVTVLRIPLTIRFVEMKSEYRSGEDIKVKAIVVDQSGNAANVSCRARIDVYDALFKNLLDSYTADMSQEYGIQTLTVQNPKRPARVVTTVTCSGNIYEERTERTEVTAKQLGREAEEGALLALSITSAVLVGLILLIRRKLKIKIL